MSRHLQLALCLSLSACSGWFAGDRPLAQTRATPTDAPGAGLALDLEPLVVLDLPSDTRDGRRPSRRIPLGGWEPLPDTRQPTFEIPAPIRPRASFFARAPRGTRVVDGAGRSLPYASGALRRWWRYDEGRIRVQVPGGATDLHGMALESTLSASREARLNLAYSGIEDPGLFSRARLQIGDDTHEGLFLPAPAQAAIDLRIPAAGELHMRPLLVPPELADLPPGDGATVHVEVEDEGERVEVYRQHIEDDKVPEVHIDLSRWAGRDVRLHLRTEPGESSRYDYILLADPIVASRRTQPVRTVVIFIDTLRADHLPTYGAERPTAPWIDAKAQRGAVFERAHSVAPWTLPSYRAMWTGRRPTRFTQGETLGTLLRQNGVATAMIGANLYLSNTFSGARGFGHHHVEHLAPAQAQVDRAIRWLDAHPDRDALLMLHLMDPHLPYREPEAFRSRFAGPAPDGWRHGDDFLRGAVRGKDPAVRQWIRDRYDNNIAYVDAQLSRLDASLRPGDRLVILSDHGEEFWDHGGFEHGHSLHEELVRIPLIVHGPEIAPGRHPAPVSLLDVAPTIASWFDVQPSDADGRDLSPYLKMAAPSLSADHAIPLGHPLYGFDRWGVSTGRETYETHAGSEQLYRLDDAQQVSVQLEPPAVDAWRTQMAKAHAHPVVEVTRLAVRSRGPRGLPEPLVVELEGDLAQVESWLGEDATARRSARLEQDASRIRLEITAGWRGSRELYLMGSLDGVTLRTVQGPASIGPLRLPTETFADGITYFDQPLGDGASLQVTRAVTLQPSPTDSPTSGYDPELRAMLEGAGYLTDP